MTHVLSPLVAAALLLGTAVAQSDATGLVGTARTVDGRVLDGTLRVTEDGTATLTTDTGTTALQVAELTEFQLRGAELAELPASGRVWLRSGLVLPMQSFRGTAAAAGKPATGKPASMQFDTPGGLIIEVPLGTVAAVRHGGSSRPEPTRWSADLAAPPANDDVLFVFKDQRAQRSLVTVTGLDATNVHFLLRGEAYEFERDGVAGIVFGANTGLAPDRQPKPRTRIALRSGEVLEGRLLTADAEQLRCRLDEGSVVVVPAAKLLRLTVASDRLRWLSELQPAVLQTPAFDRTWAPSIDRAPGGPGFVIDGVAFSRGICLIPRTRLTYDLAGTFDVFEATIGIDDRSGQAAHAVFRVYVDDRVAFESTPKTHGQTPEWLRIPLQKARSLALEVDFGKNYDLGDHCVFADARVVQQ